MPVEFMLDTNIVLALMRAPWGPLRRRIETVGESSVCVSIVTTAELHFGAALTPSSKGLANFALIMRGLRVLPIEPPADANYGRIRADLHRRGRLIGPNDMWIAAHALALDLTLVTANTGEFSRVPGLRLENWLD
jgi:tRNA(fMet)-specific endonuclease VapC